MGRASKWFRGLLGLKSADPNPNQVQKPPLKKKWSFVKDRHKSQQQSIVPSGHDDSDASKHAIAVAAATAAVAEVAVAAAQAAASVVQLTSSGRNISTAGSGWDVPNWTTRSGAFYGSREERAAVMIQSHFRAYLSKRALRALKALVKLQALVRGHLVRKQTAYALRRLQALVRAQVRARAGRGFSSESPHSSIKSSHFSYPGPATPEKFEHIIRARSAKHEQQLMMLKRNGSKSNPSFNHGNRTLPTDDDRIDKILEVDTIGPHTNSKSRSLIFYSSHLSLGSDQNCRSSSPSSAEVQSFSTLRFAQDLDESAFCTADNSPAYYSASSSRGGGSSKRGAFTPTKSEASRSCLSGYSDHPNYMAYTESSKAKVRSVSAPKQRPHQFERSGSSSTKRYSIHGFGGESRSRERTSALHDNFTNKAYPGSGRLDKIGMPVSGGNWQKLGF